jgi:ActR/RegA family two-component response regulator
MNAAFIATSYMREHSRTAQKRKAVMTGKTSDMTLVKIIKENAIMYLARRGNNERVELRSFGNNAFVHKEAID